MRPSIHITAIVLAALCLAATGPAQAQERDCIVDTYPDTDCDDTPDYLDLDSDDDGLPDRKEWFGMPADMPENDIDNDGVYNFRDLDSDGDEVSDADEIAVGRNPYVFDTIGEGEGDIEQARHAADTVRDGRIDLSELLRVIQIYNSGGYHCPVGAPTEDGVLPGGDAARLFCAPHSSDYKPQDWQVTLSELLRLIQFFNAFAYHPCDNGEDSFCAGAD